MTVYVDDMHKTPMGEFKAGNGRVYKMCHMLADTDEELHAMAARIGMKRSWYQAPPKHDSHYDIAMSKRALAVAAGAVEITWKQAGAMNYRRRITGELGKPEEAVDWMLSNRAENGKAQAAEGRIA
ncbi:DUF4031 domain-containing protein [Ralstonia sp. ASV6]|uniref:DUF4031 domain-containing protein n=1 Tax=Ralstonia sp. ASV6 TaxID=2795124 RepID=UPI0018EA73B5|nr:DUF4031 domain-containing protein [Ralstonia sp. ASV6]